MQEQMVRLAFLERILYIVCHSKQVGNPPNHVLFTIHVPAEELLPELPVPILAVSGKFRPRTVLPRLPCLF